jgi:energy-coupling factor transport system substrate-specific component
MMSGKKTGLQPVLTMMLFALSAMIGVVALAYPFFSPAISPSDATIDSFSSATETPLLAVLLICLSLAVLLVELQGQSAGAKTVAALGVLVAVTTTLRFIEVAIPGPGGFSPIFVPIILSGYVFGPRFGFLMGAMTLLISAIITAGVGPWLPYQMFTAGWMGLTSGWLPHLRQARLELGLLLLFGFGWGLLYGAIMNLYSWPYLAGPTNMTWTPGTGLSGAIARYATFYLATSLIWDLAAAVGNMVLLLILGIPTIRALNRFRDRLQFQTIYHANV